MIPEKTKSRAIAKLKHRVPPEDISEELGIPVKLIKNWQENLDPSDLIAVEANIAAVEKVLQGEVMGEDYEAKLKETLELTAIDLAKAAAIPVAMVDPIQAKAIQLCSDAISKLYATIILKGGSGTPKDNNPGGGQLSTFQQLMKD